MFDEYDSKLTPEDRVNHIAELLESWIERNAPRYFNRDRLESLVRKIRQQYIGNIRKCKDWHLLINYLSDKLNITVIYFQHAFETTFLERLI